MQAVGTGSLQFKNGVFVNNTSIDVLDGSKLDLDDGTTLRGGTLTTAGTGVVNVTSNVPANLTLDAITNAGQVSHANGQKATAVNGLTNNGVWSLNGINTPTGLEFDGNQTLGGAGRMAISNNGFNYLRTTSGGTLTQAASHTIEGGGSIEANLVNEGTVNANAAVMRLNVGTKTNNGLMTATSGGRLEVEVNVDGTGDWVADGGKIQVESGVAVTTTGNVSVVHNGELELTGSTVAAANLRVDRQGVLDVNSGLDLSGNLRFRLKTEGQWQWATGSTLQMSGGVGATAQDYGDWGKLEIGGVDLGTDPVNHVGAVGGFSNNFNLPELIIGTGAHVFLADFVDNGNRGGVFGSAEALYVDTLTFADTTSQLNLNGLHLYYNTLSGNPGQIVDDLIPEPATALLLTLASVGLLRRQRA